MHYCKFWLLVFAVSLRYRVSMQAAWPAPGSLIAFWPLDSQSGLSDIANGRTLSSGSPSLMTSIYGPFGKSRTSYSVSSDNSYIGYRSGFSAPSSFTFSFYYNPRGSGTSSIAHFCSGFHLSLYYVTPNYLQVEDASNRLAVLPSNTWTFLAVTYNLSQRRLAVYNSNGNLLGQFSIAGNSVSHICLGGYSGSSGACSGQMRAGDAMACAMLYNTELQPSQIAQLPSQCFAAQVTWPAPGSLVAFWPLTAESQLNDVINGRTLSAGNPSVMTSLNGPFGKSSSSYTVRTDSSYIGDIGGLPTMSEYTFSFYYYPQGRGTSSIAHFCTSVSHFTLQYFQPNYLHIGEPTTSMSSNRLSVLPANRWTFLAVTYSYSQQRLSVYDSSGSLLGQFSMNWGTNNWIGLGSYAGGGGGMLAGDAIACAMLYSTILQPSQIAQLSSECRAVQGVWPAPESTTPTTTTTTMALPTIKPWPRPESLLAFWPLDSRYKFNDVTTNRFTSSAMTAYFQTGPFGDADTAARPSSQNAIILQATTSRLAITGSFTVSLFLSRGTGSGSGGIFEFQDRSGSSQAFQFRYEDETTIEVSANGHTVGHCSMIQPKAAWTFAAFVFDASTSMFTVYGRHGVVAQAERIANITNSNTYNNNGIRLGYASRWSQGLRTSDSVACLMIYPVALTGAEIRQAHDACRIIHRSVPCGSPRLALSPPSTTTQTVMAKAGEFPYIASLRYRSMHLCSVNIIDAFWLVTSRQCFAESTNPAFYSVLVGEHDLAVAESHTRNHTVSKIILQKTHARDLALVQLTDPIDFTTKYVNDACFYAAEDLSLNLTQFLFGWGQNGRSSLVSASLPRYVPGSWMGDDQCTQAWGTRNYTAGSDICFLSSSTDKNVPCLGDEGSPLLVWAQGDAQLGTSDRLVEAGIYYKRDLSCSASKPGLFANIAKYNKWISEKIACAVPGFDYPAECPQD